jgi:Kef-type K+ transport system membrane component KefB
MSVDLTPGLILLLWVLGLVGNAVWAVSTLFGALFGRASKYRMSRRDRLAVGLGLTAMFAVSLLIFVLLVKRWVRTDA